jgi:hypothetical protein
MKEDILCDLDEIAYSLDALLFLPEGRKPLERGARLRRPRVRIALSS